MQIKRHKSLYRLDNVENVPLLCWPAMSLYSDFLFLPLSFLCLTICHMMAIKHYKST